MAAWGDTEGGDARMPPGYGQDGSGGAQPRGNVVAHNLCRELGIWEKQSSCYTQFKASENVVAGNIMFNGPRAHINFNDGMRGGALVEKNLIFNSCRESGDHGPCNSVRGRSAAARGFASAPSPHPTRTPLSLLRTAVGPRSICVRLDRGWLPHHH